MKRVLAVLGETVLFLLTGIVFMFWRPFHVTRQLASHTDEARAYQFDWIIGIALVAIAIAVIELMAKRLNRGWPQLVIALAIALALGIALKFGLTSDTTQLVF